MKDKILEEAKKHAEEAKRVTNPDIKVTLKSGGETFLSRTIKTQEQADLFMKMLRSL